MPIIGTNHHTVTIPCDRIDVRVAGLGISLFFDKGRAGGVFWASYMTSSGERRGINDIPIGVVFDAIKKLVDTRFKLRDKEERATCVRKRPPTRRRSAQGR